MNNPKTIKSVKSQIYPQRKHKHANSTKHSKDR